MEGRKGGRRDRQMARCQKEKAGDVINTDLVESQEEVGGIGLVLPEPVIQRAKQMYDACGKYTNTEGNENNKTDCDCFLHITYLKE